MERDPQNPSTQEICRRIYSRTRDYYKEISTGREDVGFQILYGPPFQEAPILFLGYQPGKGTKTPLKEREDGSEDRWPEVSEYVTESWPLAKKLRNIFGTTLLHQCVGLNAIFIRSDSIEAYQRNFDLCIRRQIKEFCLPCVCEIIEAIRPRKIVAIGIETLRLFGKADPCLMGDKDVSARMGTVAGRDVIGVIHLTGARMSTPDRKRITDCLLAYVNSA